MLSARGKLIALLVEDVVAEPPSPNQSIDVDPAAFVNPPVANDLLFGSIAGPITPSNVDSGQSLAVTVTSIQGGLGSNIQGFFPGATMAFSGLWKFTAIIKAGDRGKSSSVVWSGSTNIASAVSQARTWASRLVGTFGNAGASLAPVTDGSAGSPYVRAIRVSDAINPRLGSLVKSPSGNGAYCGYGTGAGDASTADFISTALSLRLTATTTETVPPSPTIVNQVVYANHALLGIPDDVVVDGDQFDTSALVGSSTFSAWAGQYIAWLINPVNTMGCITTPLTQTQFKCTNFTRPAGGLWQFVTATPHGYSTGDRVRLTKCNAPFFAGSYKVNVIDAVTLSINNGPPASVAPPTTGSVRRYMDLNNIRYGVFAQFSLPAGETADPWNLSVSKRNPGRAPSLVSFRKRPRRAH